MVSTVCLEMPVYCFDVIISKLKNTQIPTCPTSIPNHKFPLFVTWKKGQSKRLRGCIGTFSRTLSLHQGLRDFAQNSAFEDSRFEPINYLEIPQLTCSVSLLVNFEPAKDYQDWVIGVHGIKIEYQQYGQRLNAVFLPEVAFENEWDHIETLNHLMHKGGFKGFIQESDRQSVIIERFQSEKITINYREYCEFKQNLIS